VVQEFQARQKKVHHKISSHAARKRLNIESSNRRKQERQGHVQKRHSQILEEERLARDQTYSTIMRKLVRSEHLKSRYLSQVGTEASRTARPSTDLDQR
jgi:hypothetical protein